MSKIIQVTCSQSQDADNGANSSVYALTDDGRVFELHDQDVARAKSGGGGVVGVWSAFWRPLPSLDVTMPAFVPLQAGVTERDVHAHHYVERVEKAAAVKKAAAAQADVF